MEYIINLGGYVHLLELDRDKPVYWGRESQTWGTSFPTMFSMLLKSTYVKRMVTFSSDGGKAL